MLDFMRALEAQAKRLYEDKCFGHYAMIERVKAENINLITARLRPNYRHVKVSIDCVGLRLRIIGDASVLRNNGFYCQFRLYPSEKFRARHCATLSLLDLSGAGWVNDEAETLYNHFALPQNMKSKLHSDKV